MKVEVDLDPRIPRIIKRIDRVEEAAAERRKPLAQELRIRGVAVASKPKGLAFWPHDDSYTGWSKGVLMAEPSDLGDKIWLSEHRMDQRAWVRRRLVACVEDSICKAVLKLLS